MRLWGFIVIGCAAVLGGGCAGNQSALDPAGPQSTGIRDLFWLFLGVSIVVQVLVTAALLPPLRRRSASAEPPPLVPEEASRERRTTLVVGGLVLLTTVILAVLMVGDFLTGRAAHATYADPDPLKIKVVGHQWWWEVNYPNEREPYKGVLTANEIHIPVGRTVEFSLDSVDVIHSFWIPNLHGKKDMIPGHPTTLRLKADRPGLYYGQCAEFCGHQHAKMRLTVVVESQAEFDKWMEAQNRPAPTPIYASQKRGLEVFLTSSCVMCHQIDGTPARSRFGPVLTHLASRPTIAGGSLANTRGNLAGWILDPHAVKPGVRMPQNNIPPADLHALLDYLEMLK
ncbi:MAG TPA: cytochrome c oxidase subunit II [Tepidisphaeraceae bacterium]|nr:cytochrome c oxidase subunit II [Tepidisphaeraceae bacterium]